MANTNGYRFTSGANQDNTFQTRTQDRQTIAYAATPALIPNGQYTFYDFAQLTGAMTLTIDTVQPLWGDTCVLQFAADGTNRVVTFSTGFATGGTLTVLANKFGNLSCMFTANGWIETARTLTA